MNWYKKAQDADRIYKNILIWLEQAQQGPVDLSLVEQDLDIIQGSIGDPSELYMAADNAARYAADYQGAPLNESQEAVLSVVKRRLADIPQEQQLEGGIPEGGEMFEETAL